MRIILVRLVLLGVVTLASTAGQAAAQPYGWSPQTLVAQSGALTRQLVVLDLATIETVARLNVPPGVALGPGQVTPDGRYFLIATSAGLARVRTNPPAFDSMLGPAAAVARIVLVPGATRLEAFGAFGRVMLDWETGAIVEPPRCCQSTTVAYSPDGQFRIELQPGTGTPPASNELSVFQVASGAQLWTTTIAGAVGPLAVSNDLLAASLPAPTDVTTVLWHLPSGVERHRFAGIGGILEWTASGLAVLQYRRAPLPPDSQRLSVFDPATFDERVIWEGNAGPEARATGVTAAAGGRHLYVWSYRSLMGITVSSTHYALYDVETAEVVSQGTVGSQEQPVYLEPAEPCLFTLPPSLTIPAEGGVVAVAVAASASCRPWRTSSPNVLNPGPHAGSTTLLWSFPASSAATNSTTVLILGRPVRFDIMGAPPAAPALTVALQANQARLSWSLGRGAAVSDFVVKGAVEGTVPVAIATLRPSQTSWVSPVLAPGSYSISVEAQNGAGVSTSDVITFSVGASAAPTAPVNVAAVAVDDQITVSWAPPSSGTAPEGYGVEAAPAGQTGFVEVTRTSDRSLYLTRVPVGTWQIRVRARTAAGAGPASVPLTVSASACTSAPGRPLQPWSRENPGIPILRPDVPTTYSVGWNAPDAGSVEAYVIEAGSSSGATDYGTFVVHGGQRSVTQALGAVRAFVRVRARNACGVSAPSDEILVLAR